MKNTVSEVFYAECLEVAKLANVPFVIGGGYAVNFHTGIDRFTKDIDIFCKPGDFPRILNKFSELGYAAHVEDERWLAKVKRGDDCVDVIFGAKFDSGRADGDVVFPAAIGKILQAWAVSKLVS